MTDFANDFIRDHVDATEGPDAPSPMYRPRPPMDLVDATVAMFDVVERAMTRTAERGDRGAPAPRAGRRDGAKGANDVLAEP